MPLEWVTSPKGASDHSGALSIGAAKEDAPICELHLWPYRSLPKRGFVWFIGVTSALVALPLLISVGSPILWGLLPFILLAVGGVWYALNRSYQDGAVLEELTLWADHITLTRHNPRAADQTWQANPYWVSVQMLETGGPVENYVTLKGNGREVEIGAFLTVDERAELYDELRRVLGRL
jgi:uncharacterized membrane protein